MTAPAASALPLENPRGRGVCVTGMHRSGTSFIAGALGRIGVSLGDPARMLRPGSDNPKGYFEIQALQQLDDELLAYLGGAWDQPPVLQAGWEHTVGLESFRERAAEILVDSFGAAAEWSGVLAWKDPRLSLLLPFWRTVTPIATTIVVVRDPVEVVASLGARGYQVGPVQAASLWLRYLFAATGDDPGHLLVRHNDIFDDLSGTVARLAAHVGLPAPDAANEAGVRERLDTDLRHHNAASLRRDAASLRRDAASLRRDAAASLTAEAAPPAADNPLLELASAVWNGGAVDVDLVPAEVGALLGRGWLRPPMDGELLARARADVVAARETLRKTNRRVAKLEAQLSQAEPGN